MNFPRRPVPSIHANSKNRSNRRRVKPGTFNFDPDSRLRSPVSIQLRRRAILGYGNVRPSIVIEIRHGRPALLPVNCNPGSLAWDCFEPTSAIAEHQEPASGVGPGRFGFIIKEVLA
jgi:hypothetical protein